jgi:putative endonuclease
MISVRDLQAATLGRVVTWADRIAAWRGRVSGLPAHLATGISGEEAAFLFLMRNGFIVVAQRWNDGPQPGDVDIIAWQDEILCFIEVKTRTSRGLAPAALAVDQNKRKILRRLARHYLRQLPGSEDFDRRPETRFDIVTVYNVPGETLDVRLIPAAFGWRERD